MMPEITDKMRTFADQYEAAIRHLKEALHALPPADERSRHVLRKEIDQLTYYAARHRNLSIGGIGQVATYVSTLPLNIDLDSLHKFADDNGVPFFVAGKDAPDVYLIPGERYYISSTSRGSIIGPFLHGPTVITAIGSATT